MNSYKDNEDEYEEALSILETRLLGHYSISDIDGAGKCIDFRMEDEKNREFGTSEITRENWTRGDTSTSNEAFRVDVPRVLKQLMDHDLLKFNSVNCVVYDHGEGKGDREFGLWIQFHFNAKKVLEMEEDGTLREITRDPSKY